MESGEMLCFSAVWYDRPKKAMFYSKWEHGHDVMVAQLWALLNQADVVTHYNGRRFDVPWAQRCFVEMHLDPPAPFRQIDLYSVVRSQFRFPSNKLAYVSEHLLGDTKVKHEGHQLWVAVMNGDVKAQARMKRYCIKDTRLLIPLYERLLPWIPRIPSTAVYTDEGIACVACGGQNYHKEGLARTQTRIYQRYACGDCGKWFRGTRSLGGVQITETPIN